MIELPIGELHLRCVEDDGTMCRECFFSSVGCDNIKCDRNERSDHKNVHFELIDISTLTYLTETQKQTIIDSFYTCQDKWVAKRTIEMVEEMLKQKDKDNESN